MRFKIVDGSKSFIYEAGEGETVAEMYEKIQTKLQKHVFIFKRVPRVLIECSDAAISSVLSDLECLYTDSSKSIRGPVQTAENTLIDQSLTFSVFVVPSDNSCLFHSLSELLSARSSGELRKMVADTILGNPEEFSPFLEKEPFAYSKWILNSDIWGGATEITVISKIYTTKVCVIDPNLQPINFGDDFRSVVYLMYTGTHYNAIIAKDKAGVVQRKFPRGDNNILQKAKEAVKNFST
ncbi:ubiquitin thioesterase OTU1 [Nematocida displodere]|uniref:Ubiquitin thioesterase OTU n=1 Tax=Nematocida displodere TaxID=1805483 RepID=A0A177EDE9_9MICR|nr:ubiquitin thioesterase OTU1 [Nematocida displodere]